MPVMSGPRYWPIHSKCLCLQPFAFFGLGHIHYRTLCSGWILTTLTLINYQYQCGRGWSRTILLRVTDLPGTHVSPFDFPPKKKPPPTNQQSEVCDLNNVLSGGSRLPICTSIFIWNRIFFQFSTERLPTSRVNHFAHQSRRYLKYPMKGSRSPLPHKKIPIYFFSTGAAGSREMVLNLLLTLATFNPKLEANAFVAASSKLPSYEINPLLGFILTASRTTSSKTSDSNLILPLPSM